MADAPLLTMSGVRKRFGATVALDGVDLEVRAGEVLALVGENGAGKSTLMKILSGAHAPDEGAMFLGGEPYRPNGPASARAAGVAMIYQELSLALDLSVEENILLGIEPRRGPFLDRRALKSKAREAMAAVGHPDVPPDLPVGELSPAMRQVVEIARAVALGSRVLVLDEPTSSLGREDVERLFDLVRRLKASGQAIVYISHFLEEVRALADRVAVLRDGKSVGGGPTASLSDAGIVALMVGRDVEDMYPRSARTSGEVVLSVAGLSGAVKPLEAGFELRRGEVLGIAGLVGAGRTELLRAIFGLDPVRRGTVRVGASEGFGHPAHRWRQGLGYVSEDRKEEGLALGLGIDENVALADLPRFLTPRRISAGAERHADRMGVKRREIGQPVGDLSGGNQQKVALARLLHHDADVLLLDEPTRGIDVGSKAAIYGVIDQLAANGKAILVVSSYLPELLGICDRIAVMASGRLGAARPVAERDEREILAEALGTASGNPL